ncbi:cupin domain-containing protein [Candidatus Entotheonella serta]|nr:cupin domain-containing protein [Candidatus Entotheonella serta]
MLQAIDIKAELAKLPFLHGRTQHTPAADAQAAFATLTPYRDGGVFAGSFSGESQWERHRQGDEIVHILDGFTILTIMTDEGPQSFDLTAGMMVVVPQGFWHQFRAPEGVTVMTITPQPTEHISGDDSRSIELSAQA